MIVSPVVAAAALTVAVGVVCWPALSLHPATRTKVLAVLIASTGVVAGGWAVTVVGAHLVGLLPESLREMSALRVLSAHHGSVVTEVIAAALLAVAVGRGLALFRASVTAEAGDISGLVLTDDDSMTAYAVSGPQPSVALSRALVEGLSRRELGVVIAHEMSHLRNRHHRFVAAAQWGTAFAPWLIPAMSELRYQIERWSDEDSAEECGDRRLVALTVAKVALANHEHRSLLGFGGSRVPGRVAALLDEPPPRMKAVDAVTTLGAKAAATGLAGSALQLHHLIPHFG